jgi:hypothetical protein
VIAPSVAPGTTSATAFTHYSMLRTTKELLGVGSFLGNADDDQHAARVQPLTRARASASRPRTTAREVSASGPALVAAPRHRPVAVSTGTAARDIH